MTKRRLTFTLVVIVLLAMVALPVAAQSYPNPGVGSTYTELVNKSATDDATAQLTYYDTTGGVHQGPQRTVPANGSIMIDPDSVQLPQNFQGAGVVSSNQPLASVVKTAWTGGPGDGFQMAYYSGVSQGSSKICFPSLFKIPPSIYASFTVQNTGTGPADIQITYFSRDGNNEGQFTDTIPAGAQHTYDLSSPGGAVPNLTDPWDGSAVVEVTNGQTVAGVGVVYQQGRTATYNAPDCAGASGATTLVVPSQYRQATTDGRWLLFSALNIQNLEGSEAHVTLEYTPRDASINPSKTVNITIPPYSAAGLNTRNGGDMPSDFFDDLGATWDGSVTITSDKAVVANVITQWWRSSGKESGYYAAPNTQTTSSTFYVPGVRRIKENGAWKEFSAVIVQNLTSSNNTITTKFYDRNGNLKLTRTDTLAPGAAIGYNTKNGGSLDPTVFEPLGDNFEGHAVITGNGAIGVVLNGISKSPMAGSATTNGIPE
ncbi:MAG TPA: hypothetical protein G4O05_02950 [Caldilineae bacterium]|nr:hypothetical protein [Caldilineae bacterium]HIQ12247.1 hypothetical protein [Caldilineales bacterium]